MSYEKKNRLYIKSSTTPGVKIDNNRHLLKATQSQSQVAYIFCTISSSMVLCKKISATFCLT